MRRVYLLLAGIDGVAFRDRHHLLVLHRRQDLVLAHFFRNRVIHHIAVDGLFEILLVVHMVTIAQRHELVVAATDTNEQ